MTDTLPGLEIPDGVTHAGQWRLAEVQLANWGTFHGAIYRIPVARRGHLLTGPSGSGKSSLLDGIAAILTPDKWLRFNQAAQSAGARHDQRSVMSYVRGAWSRTADETEDRVVSAYLRPRATWSGVLLRYENGEDKPVTLARLFFARGTSTSNADLADLCLLERSVVDLRELEPFARGGIETRKVKAAWPDAVVTTNGAHSSFYARLRTIFAIDQETALQLLHKTQSAKTLDSLDALFRDYMLERPGTFDLADTAVNQFTELRNAHDHVVRLREQRDHLAKLAAAAATFETHDLQMRHSRELGDAIYAYRKHETLRLAHAELAEESEALTRLEADVVTARTITDRAQEHERLTAQVLQERGGGEIGHLQVQLRAAAEATRATNTRRETMRSQLADAGIEALPSSAAEFAELMTSIDRAVEGSAPTKATAEQNGRLFEARAALRNIDGELAALRQSGTTVPSVLVQVRSDIAEQTGLPLAALPFGAELLTVREEYAAWTGAIERVLRPLALTMLVRSENLAAVRECVEHRRIPVRLVYEEVAVGAAPARPARSDVSLVNRVQVASGSFHSWLSGQLSERFDFACVENTSDLDHHVRAVTINGQVKSSRTRYEKDDRSRIDDRSSWVLGDHEGKLEALLDQRQSAKREVDEAQAVVDGIDRQLRAEYTRVGTLIAVRKTPWADVDVASAVAHEEDLTFRLTELTSANTDLDSASQAADEARAERRAADAALQEVMTAHHTSAAAVVAVSRVVDEHEREIATGFLPPVPEALAGELGRRFRGVQRRLTRENLPDVADTVRQRLDEEAVRAGGLAQTAADAVARYATQFLERWPTSAADLTPTLADRGGFLELLDGIVANGLPEHEARFLDLLRERSRDLIGELVSDILTAPKEIEERVVPVNESLRRSPFDDERFLRLRVKLRRTETVTRFIADLRSITEASWGSDDLVAAERRFNTLEEIMRRFASSDHVDRTWRTQVLDTRLHVTFLAEEIDAAGRVHATYDSGAAMSGGQQQKLVVFCLAAALRYQLADADDGVPSYGTVILDEAFDKADTRFTRMALDVFVEFGFHLVLATPQKLLQTIEPYVGGATSVENPDRRRSRVANVPWDERGLPVASA